MKSIAWFLLAAVFEIAGCYAFWAWLRAGRSAFWIVAGIASLAAFAWVLTRAEVAFAGRAYAAYGGIYIVSALIWLWLVERQRPDLWDTAGALMCIGGALIILFGPRG